MATETVLEQLSEQFEDLYSHPDSYLDPPEGLHKELVSHSKTLYDFMKTYESSYASASNNSLRELLVSGFDDEQIWQEIQLQNNPCLAYLRKNIKGIATSHISLTKNASINNSNSKKVKGKTQNTKHNKTEATVSGDDSDDEIENEICLDSDDDFDSESVQPKKYKRTVVDDNFFKLRQMEEFLDQQDREEELRRDGELDQNEDAEMDLFNDMGEDEG